MGLQACLDYQGIQEYTISVMILLKIANRHKLVFKKLHTDVQVGTMLHMNSNNL